MLIIADRAAFEAIVAIALEHDRLHPAAGVTSSSGYLGPILSYLDDFGCGGEFKFASRTILSLSDLPPSMHFTIEIAQPGGGWQRQVEGMIAVDPGPPPVFRLRFGSAATQPSAA